MINKAVRFLAAVSVVLLLLGKAGHAYQQYLSMFFSLDNYFLYDASKELLLTGIGRVPFLPHSSQGWDLFLWSYYVPMYAYALLLQLLDFQFHQSAFLHFAQYLVLLAALCVFFRRHLAWPGLILALSLVLLEPLYFSIAAAHFHLWPMTFALIAIAAFESHFAVTDRQPRLRKHLLAAVAGLMASASFFSFPAIGLPILAGLSVAFLLESLDGKTSWRTALMWMVPYCAGALIPLGLFVFDVFVSLDGADLGQLIATLAYHYGSGAESSILGAVTRSGYFVAGVLVSPRAPSLLLGGLLLTGLSIYLRRELSQSDQRFIRLATILSVVWVVFGILLPHHVNAPRMVALLPVYVVVFAVVVRYRRKIKPLFGFIMLVTAVDFGAQILYHELDRPFHPYGIGLMAAVVVGIAVVGALWLRFAGNRWLSHAPRIHVPFAVAALIMGACVVAPSLAKSVRSLEATRGLLSEGIIPEPVMPEMNARLREVTQNLVKAGDRVLSNVAMREYLEPGIKRHQIRFYRGLFNGVTEQPADVIVLVGNSPSGQFYPNYQGVRVGEKLYYRGHLYALLERVKLGNDYYALVGRAVAGTEQNSNGIIYPKDYVPQKAIDKYLKWRKSRAFSSD